MVACLFAVALLFEAATATAQIIIDTWRGGSGLWNVAADWTTGVPNNGTPAGASYNVLIDNGNAVHSVVSLNQIATINNLTINSGDSLAFNNGTALTVNGSSIANAGNLSLNSAGSLTELVIGAPNVTLNGGAVTMSNNANNYIFGAATTDTLTNQETIQGAGHIGNGRMTLVNSGTINANQSAGMTIQANGGATNSGTLEATAGSTLNLTGTTVANTGTLSANGSHLQLINTTINGGKETLTGASTLQLTNGIIHSGSTLSNSATGTIEALAGTSTLGGTISNPTGGLLKIDNGAALNLENGTYATLGAVQLNSANALTELIVDGANVTLSGGAVTMSNNANNYIFGAATTDTLTNQETIQGAGHIGNGRMTLVNSGTINANQSAGMTIQANGGATNSGTLEATAGSTLNLTGTTVANTGTLSANGSHLQLINTTINGGKETLTGASTLQLTNGIIHSGSTLSNSATGTIEALAGTSTLGGTISNPTGGLLKIDNGAALNLENGTYATLGAVQLNSANALTELIVDGANVTLSGGAVTMSNNANNYIFGAATTDTLTNQETIQGAGHIGNGRMTLVNSGTINANQSAGMTIQANGGATNSGTLEATAGSTLNLTGTTVANTGTLSANGSHLQLINTTINGGKETLTGASTLQLTNGIIHSGSTLSNSATGTIEALAGTSTLGGTISNPTGGLLKIDNGAALNLENGTYATLGAVQLNSANALTELIVDGANVTLSGGAVTMSNNANNYIFGAATTDTLTNQETIQGAGHIGNGRMTLVNSGTINANQSAGMTIQANGGATNSGTLEATAGSTLNLTGTTVANTGTLSANGSHLQLINTTINGGKETLTGASTLQLTNGIIHSGSTLSNSATGTIEALAGTSTLGGTISNPTGGLLKIDNGAALNLENGTYATLGAVQLNSANALTELIVDGANVTLSGGAVTMSNNANNYIFGAATTDTLTNQETIQGAGHIGNGRMTLVNSGTINANQSAGMTIQANGGFSNSGTLSVSGGDHMRVFGGTFANFSGGTLTGGTYNVTGVLQIDQLGTTGGEIVTNAANIALTGSASSFVDASSKNALTNLATNAATGSFSVSGGRNFTTVGKFTNSGKLTVGSGSTFGTGGTLTNFAGTTLTGGVFNIGGTFQFAGANVVTNAANLTLTGTASKLLNSTTAANGLANLATNASTGTFNVSGGRTFTTLGNFTNAGKFAVGTGSTFTVGGTANFQSSGTVTDDGTLAAAGGVTLSAGSLTGIGSIKGNLRSSGIVDPGDSPTTTGVLSDAGAYTQNSTGSLNISIGGTTAGSKFDALNATTASLGGTLNVKLINGFVPTLGSTFKIANFNSESGKFAAVNGLAINSSEHFAVTYQPTDVLLTVVSGAATAAATSDLGRFSLSRAMLDRSGDTLLASASGVKSGVAAASPDRFSLSKDMLDRGGRFRLVDSGSGRSPQSPMDLSRRRGMVLPNVDGSTPSGRVFSRAIAMNVKAPERSVSALFANPPSMNQPAASRLRATAVNHGKLGGKTLQFSLLNLLSRPNFSFSAESQQEQPKAARLSICTTFRRRLYP
jgi:hypothetical protein